jgi:hypothetical protein
VYATRVWPGQCGRSHRHEGSRLAAHGHCAAAAGIQVGLETAFLTL